MFGQGKFICEFKLEAVKLIKERGISYVPSPSCAAPLMHIQVACR